MSFFPDAVRNASAQPTPAPCTENEEASSLMREYWDMRRKMTTIVAQAEMVEERLERIGVIQPVRKQPTTGQFIFLPCLRWGLTGLGRYSETASQSTVGSGSRANREKACGEGARGCRAGV